MDKVMRKANSFLMMMILLRMNMLKTWSSKALTVLLSSESCMKRVSYCSNPFVSVREGGAFTRVCVNYFFLVNDNSSK